VVIAIIGVLIGLLLPAVQKVREASSRARCQNNLKQNGLAFHAYQDGYKKLPPGGFTWTCQGGNYMMVLLPYLEQDAIARRLSYTTFPYLFPNLTADPATSPLGLTLPIYYCPSDRPKATRPGGANRPLAMGNYAFNLDLGTASPDAPFAVYTDCPAGSSWVGTDPRGLSGRTVHSFDRVTDGLSGTLFMSEMLIPTSSDEGLRRNIYSQGTTLAGMSFTPRLTPNAATDIVPNWFVPATYNCVNQPPFLPCAASGGASDWWTAARSKHPGGVNALFGDGSVRFAPNDVNTSVWRGAGTKSGGEAVALNF
jgi:prepilin-type processing-associated H-X9-DG protein